MIRPYVSFDYDLRKSLSTAAKKKIKKHYDEFRYLAQRPTVQLYRARNPERLKRAQAYGGHPKGYEFKVAFIPVGTEKAKIRFDRRGDIVVESQSGVKRKFVELDGHKIVRWMANDEYAEGENDEKEKTGEKLPGAEKYINARIGFDAPDAKRYTISTGANELPIAFSRKSIANAIIKYLLSYPDRVTTFNGIFALYAPKQADIREYLQSKKRARQDKARKKIINARRKAIKGR